MNTSIDLCPTVITESNTYPIYLISAPDSSYVFLCSLFMLLVLFQLFKSSSFLSFSYAGWIFPNQLNQGILIAKTKSVFKAPFSSGSTLMKPTASQLAKQNRPREMKGPRQFIQRLFLWL